ncbi:MAG TPA: ParB/RepB/Spo0J family partition protein [Kofleriaceae bacterium]|nr:ParB/RepB/Spo0J family partition protein [Kofleriaceae bacterium]
MAAEKKPRAPRAAKPKTEKKEGAAPRRPRKPKVEAGTVGLTAAEVAGGGAAPPPAFAAVEKRLTDDGGVVLGRFREPLGGHWVALAVLPIDKIEPTPYQREQSKAHVDRLAGVIPKVGRFLDPIIAVPTPDGFRSPNGMHRLAAMRALGARAITALVVPEPEVAFRILALNTEKAHNLKDKSLEVVRMVRALVAEPATAARPESEYTLELEQPSYLTIGICYEQNGRFSGGAYLPVVNKCEEWSDRPLRDVLAEREAHATAVLELDEAVNAAVQKLKESGFNSGYLKPIVVARINPLRFVKPKPGQPIKGDFDRTIARMLEGARKFDPSKIGAADVAAAAAMGGGEE